MSRYVVSVILDGENAWEYYPDNAYHFLSALYQTLVEHPQVEMTTFSEALESGVRPRHLPVLKAGSWVYGSFSTWIGEPDKNAGWDLLVDAKLTFDKVMASGKLSEDEIRLATEQLAICEGSDWFWWFGDYNPSGSVKDFDQLFRRHLEKLFILLGENRLNNSPFHCLTAVGIWRTPAPCGVIKPETGLERGLAYETKTSRRIVASHLLAVG